MLVVDDGVLALLDQQLDEVTEAASELLPELARCDQGVLAGLLLELVGHLTDDVGVLHVGLHVRSDPAPAPSGAKIKTTSVVVTNAYFCLVWQSFSDDFPARRR